MPAHFGSETITLKSGDLFFLSEAGGNLPLDRGHALGLFYHDCRFLSGYTLTISGKQPELHKSAIESGNIATLRLFNPELEFDGQTLARHSVEIHWSRTVSSERLALIDTIALHSVTNASVRFSLALRFHSEFEDLFALRGMAQAKRGLLHPPVWKNDALHFLYEGADKIDRELTVHFSPAPSGFQNNGASYEVELSAKRSQQFQISLFVCESSKKAARKAQPHAFHRLLSREKTRVRSDSESFDRIMDRSLGDLDMLRSGAGSESYFAAGVPWYVALFGRDGIIAALQMLAYDARIAEHTIRLLAREQGKRVDEWREEEPGKILHELRVGEMAHLQEIPHTPYYGTIDATPLWLVLVGRHAAWTGDLGIFNELRLQIDAALNWVERYGDHDDDGYVEYQCKSKQGLVNQGWKDSGDGIVNADGSLGTPPIALVEVQGYVFEAKIEMAKLYRRAGDENRATILEQEAQRLRERFNRDFWITGGYYALALQDDKTPAAVLSSNAGHALWSGIADAERARQTADCLLSAEMFSGWGIRTLSAAAARYNPLGYHLGTVWPHDNSLIGAGFKRYGFNEAAVQILDAMFETAAHFPDYQLPELFGGFARQDSGTPVACPIACKPQAWAAGAIPYLLTTILGLEPEAFEGRLRIVRPVLPKDVNHVEIRQLQVGAASVDLLFERKGENTAVYTSDLKGHLEIVVEL